ncbi:MAG TPA: tyrosinase family protein, partial [Vicinamibacterales bacterium]|nr:tyrosinase family protein [Vicinamibacterales bacterium]
MRLQVPGTLLLVCLLATAATAQSNGVRRSIDDPNFDLALYRRAMQILIDRDKDNIPDDPDDPAKNGYNYFARLHNGSGAGRGTCQHKNELFLTWHRALLVEFERAIQQTAPPETEKLWLPYWNWGAKPTGEFFPKAFEERNQALYYAGRDPGAAGRSYTNAQLRDMLTASTSWRGFSGGACSIDVCSGVVCAKCTAKYGSFESPYHNDMHNWVGGPMDDDTTAAIDPIFWSYHVYIDLVYDCWQRKYGYEVGCADCPMRQLPGWTPARVKRTTDLGYVYELTNTACPEFAPPPRRTLRAAEDAAPAERTIAVSTTERSSETAMTFDLTIPAPDFSTAHLRLNGLENFSDFNYRGRVYLYPAATTLDLGSEDFRKRHLAGEFSVWGSG